MTGRTQTAGVFAVLSKAQPLQFSRVLSSVWEA
jgi:hypothetical protein